MTTPQDAAEIRSPVLLSEKAIAAYGKLATQISDARTSKSGDYMTDQLASLGFSPIEVGIRLGISTLEEVNQQPNDDARLLEQSRAIANLANRVSMHFNESGVLVAVGTFRKTIENFTGLSIEDIKGINEKLIRGDDLYIDPKEKRII